MGEIHNMDEIKLTINGKELKLTPEQVEALGLEGKEENKNPFKRCRVAKSCYCIGKFGEINTVFEYNNLTDKNLYKICTDKNLMIKRAKQEALNRLLWRFSWENGWSDDLWKNGNLEKYFVKYSYNHKEYFIEYSNRAGNLGTIYFVSREIAQKAIDEIIIPFEKGELEVCRIWEE